MNENILPCWIHGKAEELILCAYGWDNTQRQSIPSGTPLCAARINVRIITYMVQ
jgi:hypothetical protein